MTKYKGHKIPDIGHSAQDIRQTTGQGTLCMGCRAQDNLLFMSIIGFLLFEVRVSNCTGSMDRQEYYIKPISKKVPIFISR